MSRVPAAHSCQPNCADFPLVWSHNTAAWVGIVLCVILLMIWRDRNSIYLKRRKNGD